MARVYVGTYKKYNAGNLAGAWLDLSTFDNYAAFVAKCKEIHSDERDPELMIQDTEDFPDGLSCMEWISEKEFNDVREAEKEETPAVQIVDYSEKAFAVIGDTKPMKDQLKRLGGRFNAKLSCGAGWIFSNKMRDAVEKFVSGSPVETEKTDGNKFVTWLNEFLNETDDKFYKEYYKKRAVGAIKIDGAYYFIEKPNIENKFCFHDEGPQYEYYKSLDDEEKLKRHFLRENLETFDRPIEHIEKGDEYSKDTRIWRYASGWRFEFYCSDMYDYEHKYTLCNDEEKALILEGLKFGRSMFKKRLDTYLKRYGVSKIHTWSYWADA